MKGKKKGSDYFYGKNVYTYMKFCKASHNTIIQWETMCETLNMGNYTATVMANY